jgi:outer membrane protein
VRGRRVFVALVCIASYGALAAPLRGETLPGALARAYGASPIINSGRASLRATDESVPQALAGMRPRVIGDALLGWERRRNVQGSINIDNHDPTTRLFQESFQTGTSMPRSGFLSVEQPLFDGFKSRNATRAAETGVFAGRERLRLLEQRVLFQAVSAYMNVLRDTAALKLQENNVAVLAEQLRQVRERLVAGQITPTDVAQAEARLAAGRAQASAARAALEASIGTYAQVIGVEPKRLSAAKPVDHLLPKTREEAEAIAQTEHPTILAALHDADAADLDIKVIESDFMPKLSLVGNVYTQSDINGRGNRAIGANVEGRLSVPIYDGGATSSRVRQAKETAGQKRFDVDVSRAELLALVRANWGALQAAKSAIKSAQAQIEAAERALYGVREEAKAGLRTTLDILNAQRELLNARIALVFAQRDRVVASYSVLAATGRLSARQIGLAVADYDPNAHFHQVKDRWGGILTPNGQ